MSDVSGENVPYVRVDDVTYDNAVGRVLHSGHVYVSSAAAPWNFIAEHQPGTWVNVYFGFPPGSTVEQSVG